ncbi:MAG: hypothetical protein ACYC8S_02055 [Minisyncoccota bacterium]
MNTITQKIVARSRFAVVVLAGALFLTPVISFADTTTQYANSNTTQYQSNSASQTSSGLVVSTQPASQVDQTTAITNGHVSTNAGDNVRVWIEWGPTPALGNVEGVRGGWKEAQTTASLGNLTPGTRYFYRAVGISVGIGDTAYGQVLSFITPGVIKSAQTTTTNTNTAKTTTTQSGTTKSSTVLASTAKTSAQKTTSTIGCATSTPTSGATIDNNTPTLNSASGLPANAAGSGSGMGVVLLVLIILAIALGAVAAFMHATASARRTAIAKKDEEQGPGMVIA